MKNFVVLLSLLSACGGTPEPVKPSATPEGRLCQRAYGSTVDSLTKLYKQAGATLPDNLPTRETYIDKCVALGFNEEQLRCLDPKIAEQDPKGCTTSLQPVKEKKAELDKLFSDAFEAAAAKEKAAAEPGAEAAEAPAEPPAPGTAKGGKAGPGKMKSGHR